MYDNKNVEVVNTCRSNIIAVPVRLMREREPLVRKSTWWFVQALYNWNISEHAH